MSRHCIICPRGPLCIVMLAALNMRVELECECIPQWQRAGPAKACWSFIVGWLLNTSELREQIGSRHPQKACTLADAWVS
jgi:hypothetical protein